MCATFDLDTFWEHINDYKTRRGFNWEQLATDVGSAKTVLSRSYKYRMQVSMQTMAKLAHTCDLDLNKYVKS